MKNLYLYKNKALNYYNGCRIFVLTCEDFDWEQIADRLKYFKSQILKLNIQENHEHWDESQDLLNQFEMDIDHADSQF